MEDDIDIADGPQGYLHHPEYKDGANSSHEKHQITEVDGSLDSSDLDGSSSFQAIGSVTDCDEVDGAAVFPARDADSPASAGTQRKSKELKYPTKVDSSPVSIDSEAATDGRGGHRRRKQQRAHASPNKAHSNPLSHESTAGGTGGSCAWCFAFLLGAALFVCMVIYLGSNVFSSAANYSHTYLYSVAPESFAGVITNLSNVFGSQPSRTWKALSSRGVHHLNLSSPSQPAVYLLAAEPAAYSTMSCLALVLARAFSGGKFARIQATVIAEKAEGKGSLAQQLLHNQLEEHLKQLASSADSVKPPPVFVVENLESLPAPSPFLFFSYCDSSHSARPQAVFIFTLRLPAMDSLHSGSEKKRQQLCLQHLADTVWAQHIHEDYSESSVEALVTRISDVTAVVREESRANILQACPHDRM